MIEIGEVNRLKVVKEVDFGLYLDGGAMGEILLPTRYVPRDAVAGDELEVFIYRDSEDRIIATTERPYVTVGEFACLKVVSVSRLEAFPGLPREGSCGELTEVRLKSPRGRYLPFNHLNALRGRCSTPRDKVVQGTPLAHFVLLLHDGRRRGHSQVVGSFRAKPLCNVSRLLDASPLESLDAGCSC